MGNWLRKPSKLATIETVGVDSNSRDRVQDVAGYREVGSKMGEFHEIIEETQRRNLNQMRDDLKKNPSTFILNNLAISVQFFDSFER